MIKIENVSIVYDSLTVLEDINLTLSERRIAIVGSNGSGKSSFARLLNGLQLPTKGTVSVDGLDTKKDGKQVRKKVGFVFQNPDNQIVFPIVEEDLAAAIQDGHVAAAAIDVYDEEPATQNPLFELENTVCTPHLGASTSEAQEKVAVQVAEQMADYLTTGAVSNALNMPSLTAEESEHLGPYMTLADQIGSFAGQLTKSGISSIKIEYEGTAAELNTRPITQSALAALLRPVLASVNLVNAPVVARERDIEVSEVKHERDHDYQTLVRVTVQSEGGRHTIAGTLFGGDKPRLVEIDGIAVEAELGPRMLYISNEDKPGLIGDVGSTLAESGINIATFHLGRAERGRDALALIEVDDDVAPHVVEKLNKLPAIRDVNVFRHPQIQLAEAAE